MIEIMAESSGNIIGVTAIGTLTDADYKEMLMPKIERLFAQYRKLRVLFYMGEEFAGWTVGAAWDDARLGLNHRSDFEKIAVVGGPRWVEWSSKFATFLITGEIRTFSADQLQDAWGWVKAGPIVPPAIGSFSTDEREQEGHRLPTGATTMTEPF